MSSLRSTDLQIVKRYAEEPDPPASLQFLEAANEIMRAKQLEFPVTIEDAISPYNDLVTFLKHVYM